MTAKSPTLEAAENNLKGLMADVARAMEKAQLAVARITGKVVVTAAENQSTLPSGEVPTLSPPATAS